MAIIIDKYLFIGYVALSHWRCREKASALIQLLSLSEQNTSSLNHIRIMAHKENFKSLSMGNSSKFQKVTNSVLPKNKGGIAL